MNCTLTDNATGKIITENFIVDTTEDLIRKKKGAEKAKLNREFKSLQDEVLGNFVFFVFKNIYNLEGMLGTEGLVKFIYLGTYVKSDMYLKLDNNVTFITKKKLQELIKITHSTKFTVFYNTLLKNNLIIEDNKGIMINPEYFFRGYEKDYKKITGNKLEEFTRIYTDTTRKLFENTNSRKHKQLAIAYKLLPYVNWKYNILCHNPNCIVGECIEPITIGEVMDILGYNKSKMARFKQDFYTIKIEDYSMFLSVQKEPEYLNSVICVNPKIFYRGNDVKELDYLLTLFRIKK